MKKTIFLPLLLTVISPAFFLGCNKDNERITTIQGRITEYGTDKPIEGARIYLLCYGGTVFGGSSSTLGDSIVTDANGEFHREYLQDDVCGGSYMIVWKEGYFKRDGLGVTTGVNNVNIALDPEAWLKIRCVADGNQSSLHFQVLNYAKDVLEWYSTDTTFRYLGGYFGGVPLYGNREERISWRTYPDQIYYEDAIYLPAHDTTTYTIHY